MDARVAAVRSRSHLRVSVASRRDDRRPRCRWAARRQPASRRRRCARCRAREVRRAPRGRSVPRRVPHGARRRRGRSARVANGGQWRRLPSRRFSDVFRAWSTGLTCAPRLYCPAAHSAAGRSRVLCKRRAEPRTLGLPIARRAFAPADCRCDRRSRAGTGHLYPAARCRALQHGTRRTTTGAFSSTPRLCSGSWRRAARTSRTGSARPCRAWPRSSFVSPTLGRQARSRVWCTVLKYAVQIVAIACACTRYVPSHVCAATRCYVRRNTYHGTARLRVLSLNFCEAIFGYAPSG